MSKLAEPSGPSPEISSGATSATALTAIGLLALRPCLSLQVREPKFHVPGAAVWFVIVTS